VVTLQQQLFIHLYLTEILERTIGLNVSEILECLRDLSKCFCCAYTRNIPYRIYQNIMPSSRRYCMGSPGSSLYEAFPISPILKHLLLYL